MKENIRFRNVADEIRKELLMSKWIPGMRVWTESELMERFRVSRNTARNAFQMLEKDGVIQRDRGRRGILVKKPADESKQRRGLNFGIFSDDSFIWTNASDAAWISVCIQEELQKHGATLSLFPCLGKDSPGALPAIREILERNFADGFFLLPTPDREEIGIFLAERKIPYVFLQPSKRREKSFSSENTVETDETNAVEEFFHDRKHIRRIVLFGSGHDFIKGRTDTILQSFAHKNGKEYIKLNAEEKTFDELIELVKRYSADGSICIVFSTDILREMDCALSLLKLRPEVLLFKHYNPFLGKYEGRYPLACRPYKQFGTEAVQMMYRQVESAEQKNWSPQPKISLPGVLYMTANSNTWR